MSTAVSLLQQEKDQLSEMVTEIRDQFLRILADSLKNTDTKGTCGFACYFLKDLLDHFTDFKITARGGDGNGDGGYIDSNGNMQGHYWLEVLGTHDTYIVDITADQFGDEPILILPISTTDRYVNGCQDTIDEHFKDFLTAYR